eukprot:1159652-Pelagomonas_calceolata.AAC.1
MVRFALSTVSGAAAAAATAAMILIGLTSGALRVVCCACKQKRGFLRVHRLCASHALCARWIAFLPPLLHACLAHSACNGHSRAGHPAALLSGSQKPGWWQQQDWHQEYNRGFPGTCDSRRATNLRLWKAEVERAAQRAEGEAGMTETGEWSNGHVTSVFESGGDGILSAEDLDTDSMKLASALLAEKRQRQKELSLTKPRGLHSHLRLHDLKSVPTSTNAKELLSKGFGSPCTSYCNDEYRGALNGHTPELAG